MCRGPEAGFRLRAFHVIAVSSGCAPVFLLAVLPVFLLAAHRCSGRRRARPLTGSTAGVSAGCPTGVLAGCGTGVPGAVGPARPPVLLPVFLLAVPPVFRAPSGPPARSPSAPRASLGASVRSPARPCGPAGALHTGGVWCALIGQAHFTCSPRTPQLLGTQPISHAISLSIFHILKDERWNCNVF